MKKNFLNFSFQLHIVRIVLLLPYEDYKLQYMIEFSEHFVKLGKYLLLGLLLGLKYIRINDRVSIVAQWVKSDTVSTQIWIQMLASLSGLMIQHCHELQCRSQTRLGSCVAVAVVQAQQLQLRFDPQPGNLHMPGVRP